MHSTCRIEDQVVYGRKGGRCEVKVIIEVVVEKGRSCGRGSQCGGRVTVVCSCALCCGLGFLIKHWKPL